MPLLTVIGAGSVGQWYASELHGEGDLRMYAAVQAYALAVLLLARPLPPRYTRGADLLCVVGFYALAKILETADRQVFRLTSRTVSGHTLKHLAAAMVTQAIPGKQQTLINLYAVKHNPFAYFRDIQEGTIPTAV